ncbi:hypothetical protein FQA47_004291 [Oryzias melastigma]|uniref:Uncharacterized protein n=1 Tax=Oryzias melastigma TaxID=30732 RepID=A0A834CK31_ORYME|nr:hypothetical protein FQA47_004291 [Oryzias melastigma]
MHNRLPRDRSFRPRTPRASFQRTRAHRRLRLTLRILASAEEEEEEEEGGSICYLERHLLRANAKNNHIDDNNNRSPYAGRSPGLGGARAPGREAPWRAVGQRRRKRRAGLSAGARLAGTDALVRIASERITVRRGSDRHNATAEAHELASV